MSNRHLEVNLGDQQTSSLNSKHNLSSQPNQTSSQFKYQPNQHPHINLKHLVLTLVLLAVIIWSIFTSFQTTIQVYSKPISVSVINSRMPRILWIYTQNQIDSEPLENDIFLNYYIELAKQNNYQVRTINSWNSYDWISKQKTQTITRTMSNVVIDQGVNNLLKLAVLQQNGGVLMDWGNLFIREDFHWLEQMFDEYEGEPSTKLGCQPKKSQIFMPSSESNKMYRNHSQSLIATVPGNKILDGAFRILSQIMTTGLVPFNDQLQYLHWNQLTNVGYLYSALEASINIYLYNLTHHQSSSYYEILCNEGMQYTSSNIVDEIYTRSLTQNLYYLSGSDTHAQNQNKYFVKNMHLSPLIPYLQQVIQQQRTVMKSKSNSLLHKLMYTRENKRIFIDPLPQRQIQLCIVVIDPLTNQQAVRTSSAFKNQTYHKWMMVLPVQGVQEAFQKDEKIIQMPVYSTEVHIIEKALAKHCPQKGYAVLLKKGQNFNDVNALRDIALNVQPYDTIGLLIHLEINQHLARPTYRELSFTRFLDGIVDPKYQKADKILNYFRIFSIQTFLQIPQFTLRDIYGKYFVDRVIFLFDLLNLQFNMKFVKNNHGLRFMIKKFAHLWYVGQRISVLPKNITIIASQWENVNKQQIRKTRTRIDCINPEQFLRNLVDLKISFRKQVAFNDAKDFVSVDDRQGPDLIPRIIHQVWLGSQIPPAKQYFIDKTKRVYPNYEIKVWRENNITRQNFPNTYDRIQTLLNFNKISPFNKLASVTDIMRHEILYFEGGFWKDAGMNLLRPIFDKFRKYQLVLPTDRLFRYRWLQGMCFFANMPKYENMLRINNYKNLNRMRLYITDATAIAGPVDFRQLLNGQQQFDSNILMLPYESFYPGQIIQHPQEDLCTKPKYMLQKNEEYQIEEKGWVLLSKCEERYPYAYAIQHNRYGNTWQFRKK